MLRFYELSPSPNNIKVRLALRLRGIPFQAVEVPFDDRAEVLRVSGQELTPVVADRGIVLPDSEGILHYLDANYSEPPRLYPPDRAGRRACDAWRDAIGERVIPGWRDIFMHAVGFEPVLPDGAHERFRAGLAWLEQELHGEHFRDPAWPICDLRAATWICHAFASEGMIARVPPFAIIKKAFRLGDDEFPRLRAFLAPWLARLE